MENNEKLTKAFVTALDVGEDVVCDALEYNSIKQWDSVAHMTLISTLEDEFDVMLDTDDIVDMSSVAKAKEILAKNGIEF